MGEPVDERLREALTPDGAMVDRVVGRALASGDGGKTPAVLWAAGLVVLAAATALLLGPGLGGRPADPPATETSIALVNTGDVVAVVEPNRVWLLGAGAREDRAPGKMIIILEDAE